MAKFSSTKSLATEEFDKEDQALIAKLAFLLNPFFAEVSAAFNKGITIDDNLNMEIKTVTIAVDAGGIPTTTASFQTSLKTKLRGVQILRAINVTSPGTYPTSGPFASFEQKGNVIAIKHITGLQAGNSYQLNLLAIG